MLSLNAAQLNAIADTKERAFLQSLKPQIVQEYKAHCYYLNDSELDDVFYQASVKAAQYDVHTERDLQMMVELSILLGHQFDKDPQCKWASDVLNTANEDGWTRISRIMPRLRHYRESLLGCRNKLPIAAWQKYRQHYQQPFTVTPPSETQLLDCLQSIWPRKFKQLSIESKQALQSKPITVAHPLLSASEHSVLAFLLGMHFDTDPIYPWSRKIPATAQGIWKYLDHIMEVKQDG